MRELKFRAWNEEEKQMALVSSLHSNMNVHVSYKKGEEKKGCFFGGNWVGADWNKQNSILMQFTGLKDKNGVEIYEGDMLKIDDEKNIWIIEYFGCGFRGKPKDKNDLMKGYFLTNNNYLQFKVIGNIHENKELV